MSRRPNILIFNPDQWRGDVLHHTGNPAALTPHLDRLVADDSVSFDRAYCQNPVCTPSRCSFMTGWYPHVRGHRTMFHMLRKDEPVLLKTLKDNGYFVWWGGKNDLVPAQFGYTDYCHVKYQPPPTFRMHNIHHEIENWRGEPGEDLYYSFYIGRLDKGESEYYPDFDLANVLGAIDFIHIFVLYKKVTAQALAFTMRKVPEKRCAWGRTPPRTPFFRGTSSKAL